MTVVALQGNTMVDDGLKTNIPYIPTFVSSKESQFGLIFLHDRLPEGTPYRYSLTI